MSEERAALAASKAWPVTEALKVVSDPEVIMELKAPNKPGVVRSGGEFVYVVMPVNLQ